jgi:chromosome partitioning protein
VTLIRGEDFQDYRILRTRIDSRKTITNEAVMASLGTWESRMFRTVIPQSEPLNQAQIARKDIFSFDGASKGAQAYQRLAEEILYG